MIKLTETHRGILASARDHEHGLAKRPTNLKEAQAIRIASLFSEHALAKEIRAKGDSPVWREDEQGRAYALKILKAGREAVDEDGGHASGAESARLAEPRGQPAERSGASLQQIRGPKSLLIIGLMQRRDGATIEELMSATGWLAHTTRAALTGLRKKGVTIDRQSATQGGGSVYRILDGSLPQAA